MRFGRRAGHLVSRFLAKRPDLLFGLQEGGLRLAYGLRNLVERFSKLKHSRRLATRYDKTADSFLGFILVASIDHRLTKVKHPWTNGQVERMNRTIKEATVKRYHYDSHQQLEAQPQGPAPL